MSRLPIVVVGAGAAGLMAGAFAGRHYSNVVILERTATGAKKILISGGGRCNILPSHIAPELFVTDSSPNTLRKILKAWPLEQIINFFTEEVGIPLQCEASSGKYFPASNHSRDVVRGLFQLAHRQHVQVRFNSQVEQIYPHETGWSVNLNNGEKLQAAAVIVATGGLSVPNTGSDGVGLKMLAKLGLQCQATYPALTPLFAHGFEHLAGVSLAVTLRASDGTQTHGDFLFTHKGFSGPAALNISHVISRHPTVERSRLKAAWGGLDEAYWRSEFERLGATSLRTILRQKLPTRLADTLCSSVGLSIDRPVAELNKDERTRVLEYLVSYPLDCTGNEGYRKAEVTGGGIALSDLVTNTLGCRKFPGLFLCGELLDAFGPIGGHNFHWAWVTGRTAGISAAAFANEQTTSS